MDNDEKEIVSILNDISTSMKEITDRKITIDKSKLPSNLSLMMTGVPGAGAIDFLFSNNVDEIIKKLLNLLETGDINKVLNNEEAIADLFKKLGFGENAFKGKISRTIIGSIQNSCNSLKFMKTKSSLKKVFLIFKNLKRSRATMKTPSEKKKFDQAIYAIKGVLKFISKIYKSRSLINTKMFMGINNLVNENENDIPIPVINFK